MQDEIEIFKSALSKAQVALEAAALMLNTAVSLVKDRDEQIRTLTLENLNLREKVEEKCLRN